MNKLINDLNINEHYTRPIKSKSFNKIKQNIPLVADYNFMADLLMLPTTKDGYKYLLTVVDLATDEVDFEPLTSKHPSEVLNAMKSIFNRPHLKKPFASIRTDSGSEFKGVFAKFLYDENILHKVADPNRHQQMANIESLNKQLGRLLNGYMNTVEERTGKTYREWPDVLSTIRTELNKIRKKDEKDPYTYKYQSPDVSVKPKYKVNDLVYRKSEYPRDALGRKQPTNVFRTGDYRWELIPRKIEKILFYSGKVPIRYLLSDLNNVSYAEHELLPAKEKEIHYIVKQIIGKKLINRKAYYLIWWDGYRKNAATWEPKDQLIKEIPEMIQAYDNK